MHSLQNISDRIIQHHPASQFLVFSPGVLDAPKPRTTARSSRLPAVILRLETLHF